MFVYKKGGSIWYKSYPTQFNNNMQYAHCHIDMGIASQDWVGYPRTEKIHQAVFFALTKMLNIYICGLDIDHINQVTFDNCFENLRAVATIDNLDNRDRGRNANMKRKYHNRSNSPDY